MIKGSGSKAGVWDDFIHTEGYAVELVADPGRGELSKAIVKKMTEITERYRTLDEFELSELTHGISEWADHYSSGANAIPWQEMLVAQNKPEMVAIVERDEKARRVFDDAYCFKTSARLLDWRRSSGEAPHDPSLRIDHPSTRSPGKGPGWFLDRPRLPGQEVHGTVEPGELMRLTLFDRDDEELRVLAVERDEGDVPAIGAPANPTARGCTIREP